MHRRKPDFLNGYLRHKEINSYLEYLERRYPTFVKLLTIGQSFEGRPIKAIKIDKLSTKNANKIPKSSNSVKNWIMIEAGTHAREWITISAAIYCIHQLTEKHFTNNHLLKKARFFIIPITNPDGYEHTHRKNRMWRKNRGPNMNTKSIGTDCNRNYDFHWEKGQSTADRNTYRGDTPFSENETVAMRNILQHMGPKLCFLLSLHSYAQTIMYPWGYTKELPKRWEKLHDLAMCGRDAIKNVSGRVYRCGSIARTMKTSYAGSLIDYAFGIVKVPSCLVMELPSGKLGFQPDKNLIKSIVVESWTGIRAMCDKSIAMCENMQNNYLISKKSSNELLNNLTHTTVS